MSLRLYDPLDSWGGPWGISAKEFVATLDEIPEDTPEIHLLLNSPGGEVWEGLAILNALRAHPARVVAVVEGIAASSASFIAAGVDELAVMANAELFVHNAWGLCVGNAADMERMRRDLTHEDRNIASIYAAKTGGTVEEWLDEMGKERWYSAQEAVDAGLADRVIEPQSDRDGAAKARARFDLSALPRAGARTTPAASAAGRNPTERSGSMPTFLDDVRSRLGAPDDADEAAVLAALDTRLSEPARPAVPEGMALIERATLDGLRADAQAGCDAHDRQQREDRERLVDAAIGDGRIAPKRRDAWLAKLEADPGEAETLASLEKGLVPVDGPRGHAEAREPDAEGAAPSLQTGADLYNNRRGKKG